MRWTVSATWMGVWAFGAVFAAGIDQARTARLANTGFELGTAKDGAPAGWSRSQWPRPEGFRLDTEAKKEGNASLRFDCKDPTDGRLVQEFFVEPDAAYRLTAWIRTEGVRPEQPDGLFATLSVRDSGGNTILERGACHAGTNDWALETVDFLGTQDGRVWIALEVASWARITGTLWFDDVRLERLTGASGLGALKDPLHGDSVRAARALHSIPPDWQELAAAIESLCSAAEPRSFAGFRDLLWVLRDGAKADAKANAALLRLYTKMATKLPADAWLPGACSIFEEAAKQPGLDAKDTTLVRLGRVRATAIETLDPAAAMKAIEPLLADDGLRKQAATVLLADVNVFRQRQWNKDALRLMDVALAVLPAADERRIPQEHERFKLLAGIGETDRAREAGRRLLAPDSGASVEVRSDVMGNLRNLEVAAGKPADGRKWAVALDEFLARENRQRSNVFYDYATALAAQARWGEAEKECRQAIAAWPQNIALCIRAQALLVSSLLNQGRYDEAVGAAKILYGVAPNSEQSLTEAVQALMQAVRAKWHSVAPANDVALFQQYGPAGSDGKPGTEDDLEDPLAKVPYGVPADTVALYKKVADSLPVDFAGRRARGYLYLFAGEPRLAAREFARGFPLTFLDQRSTEDATDDLVAVLRACCGHPLAGDQLIQFIKYGPNGPDGKPLANPLQTVLENK